MESQTALQRLKSLDVAELRRIWRRTHKLRAPPPLKRLLLRELAWQIQSGRTSGMDAMTRRLLRAAVRNARTEPFNTGRRADKKAKARRRVRLQTGARLVRKWRGREHVVTVLDGGKRFRYRGATYDSLTKIAEVITSTHWSGPRFFGLDRVRRMS